MNFKDLSCLVYDNGLFVSMAQRLARDFGRVGYFVPWENSFPDGRELIIGYGLDGITREKYFDQVYDQYDLIVFPDVFSGDLQEDLRRRGHRVWGAGMGGELELSRWKTHERFASLGLDENTAAHVIGTKALREYLQEHGRQYVKVSTFRGMGETWFAENADMAEGMILELESKHGELCDLVGFIVEDEIPDAKEIGYDGYCINGEFPEQSLYGIEIKDKAYFGRFVDYDHLPRGVRDVNNKIAPEMDNYRQFFSTEIRQKDGKNYIIDLTCRHPSPAGEVEMEMFDNLADILWNGAEGRLVSPVSRFKFGAQILLCSEWAETHWQPVDFPDELRPYVKLYNHCRINGADWVVPQLAAMKQLGSVIALGNTPEETVKLCKERAEQVHGFDLETESDSLDKAAEEMTGALDKNG